MVKFLDTNALLTLGDRLSDIGEFVISSVSLQELESIKTNRNKTEDIRWKARKVGHWLKDHRGEYTVALHNIEQDAVLADNGLEASPDNKIAATCLAYCTDRDIDLKDVVFVTNDLTCELIVENYFGFNTATTYDQQDTDDYQGFREVMMTDEDMAFFYANLDSNIYDLYVNEYLIVRDKSNEVQDIRRWTGETHKKADKKTLKSTYLDKLKAKDCYQSCVIDSCVENTITAISGKPGSGKSLLALMAAMHLIESGKYERLVILFNPVKVRGASDMGYYGGDFLDKAMQNNIGHILTTKFGDRMAVDYLLQQDKLKLVSMADCRGMEISDSEILWISEAQNTSVDLIKLCLSRVSSGAKVFIEGDYETQVDASIFGGNNNGLKRVIDVFKDHELFGYVQLQNVWRSKIAELSELL